MSKALTIPNEQKRVAEALRLHDLATKSAAQMAVAAAMCGLELKSIKQDVGHGKWEEYFESHLESRGLQLRTAQKYMAVADGLKGKALKNESGAFLTLLDCAPSELKKADQEKLTQAVSKMTDGATLSELYMDLGIVKKPQGSGAKGGKTSGGGNHTPDAELIAEGHIAQTNVLANLLDEGMRDRYWNAAPVELRKNLHGLLIDAAAAVKETLK